MKTILITGVTGFAGSFLAKHLLSSELSTRIVGTYLTEESLFLVSDIKDKIILKKIDLMEKSQIQQLIVESKPDEVYHLAALTSPAQSFNDPVGTITNNVAAQVELFEALRKEQLLACKVFITSSAEVYGAVSQQDLPMNEDTPLRPQSPYSVSKIAQDFLAYQYASSYHMNIVRVRPFNHIGPKQAPSFVVANFAKQIAEIERGEQEPVVKVGNLEAKRDFTDVRDMVRAYVLATQKGKVGEVYNIGSDTSHKIANILDTLLSLSTVKIKVEQDPKRMRPSDTPELLCDSSKFKSLTNWEPQIPLEQTLKDTLDYWRNIS